MDGVPSFKDLYKSLINEMSKDAKGFYPLEKFASIIHRQPGELILLGMMLVITLTVFEIGTNFLLVLLGCSYPGYMSLKATQSTDPDDRSRWLTYWLIFGFILSFDGLLRLVLLFIPFYDVLRLFVVIALFYPKNDLALKIYHLSQKAKTQVLTKLQAQGFIEKK